ncbi:HD domain-containing protein [Alteromonas gilva]|uniref:HD domain-containing protein n=1 Tax=Alteromonas gilva TaxID=2987522 RepID=A0ABT5L2S1_9ALTE|nr:HD domain-containing protein [Alteromonas gilva]MDC8831348.1 HD domain-containing protein [Alteromonas gilva]
MNFSEQLGFLLEMDKLKSVYRKALIKTDNNRYENSAEHSWHVALMANILAPYAEQPIDIHRVTLMLLIHDIVEIDAGDTFAFDEKVILSQQSDKEQQAATRIFGLLPEDQRTFYLSLWQEFEIAETADAKFAKSMDRVLPLLQNMQNEGGSWSENNVSKQQVINRNKHLQEIAPKLWTYVLEQIDIATEKGWLRAA